MQDYFKVLFTATAEKGPEDATRTFTLEEALRFQNELLSEVSCKQFQMKVWGLSTTAGEDKHFEVYLGKALMQLHIKVIQNYGFEGTELGAMCSAQAFAADCHAYPPIAAKREFVQYLLSPDRQKELAANAAQKAPRGVTERLRGQPNPNGWEDNDMAKLWVVVGGKGSGGIMVRQEANITSPAFPQKLQHNALVEQAGKKGDRLQYQLVDGDGPATGWVSLRMKGLPLLVGFLDFAAPKVKDAKQDETRTFIVVADRVAQREKPEKDAKVVGGCKKGEMIKGVVLSEVGADWVKIQDLDWQKESVSKYMMIDGTSIGVGLLLAEKATQKPSRWKVVHDRMAQRDRPNKDGKILEMALKDQEFKGTVVKGRQDVEWLCVKEGKLSKYMMIDGKSLGLGILLEKMENEKNNMDEKKEIGEKKKVDGNLAANNDEKKDIGEKKKIDGNLAANKDEKKNETKMDAKTEKNEKVLR